MTAIEFDPLQQGEWARLVEIEENDIGIVPGPYLLTDLPGQVDVRAKLVFGLDAETEIVWHDTETGEPDKNRPRCACIPDVFSGHNDQARSRH